MFRLGLYKIAFIFLLLTAFKLYSFDKYEFEYEKGSILLKSDLVIDNQSYLIYLHVELGSAIPIMVHKSYSDKLGIDNIDSLTFTFPNDIIAQVDEIQSQDISLLMDKYISVNREKDRPYFGVIGHSFFKSDIIIFDIEEQTIVCTDSYIPQKGTVKVSFKRAGNILEVDFLPVEDYLLKAYLTTSIYELKVDSTCAVIAGEPSGNFNSCQIGGFDISPYVAIRPISNLQILTDGYDAIIGNSLWQNFKVIFDFSSNCLYLEKKDNVKPDLDAKQYYKALLENDYVSVLAYLENHVDSYLAEMVIDVLLDNYIATEACSFSDLKRFYKCLFHVYREVIATEIILLKIDEIKNTHGLERTTELIDFIKNDIIQDDKYSFSNSKLETELAGIMLERGDYDQAYKSLLGAVFRYPDNSRANFLLGQYYQHLGNDKRAWYKYFKAATGKFPSKLAIEQLQELYNSQEFRGKYSMCDVGELYNSLKLEFFPIISNMDWANGNIGVLELFIFSDGKELDNLLTAVKAIERYGFTSCLNVVCYYVNDPDAVSLSTEYGQELFDRYNASGRPSVYVNGSSYGFSSYELGSPEKLLANLYTLKESHDVSTLDMHGGINTDGKVYYSIDIPSDFKGCSYEILVLENNVMYADDRLHMFNNVARGLVGKGQCKSVEVEGDFSWDELQSSFQSYIDELEGAKGSAFNWRSDYIDSEQCYLLAKFYDDNGIICGLARAALGKGEVSDDK